MNRVLYAVRMLKLELFSANCRTDRVGETVLCQEYCPMITAEGSTDHAHVHYLMTLALKQTSLSVKTYSLHKLENISFSIIQHEHILFHGSSQENHHAYEIKQYMVSSFSYFGQTDRYICQQYNTLLVIELRGTNHYPL